MRAQFLFYTGTAFFAEFQNTINLFQRRPHRDFDAPRPLNPDVNGESKSNHALYDEACDYAGRLAFAEAEKRFGQLDQRNDPDYGPVAYEWIQLLRQYAELIEVDKPNARFIFKKKWDAYRALFPKEFWDGIFDPKDFASRFDDSNAAQPPISTQLSPQFTEPEYVARWKSFTGKGNADWQPYITKFSNLKIPDMEFCLVPPGTFQMGSNDGYDEDEAPAHAQTLMQPYWLGVYPVTNAEWQLEVKAGVVKEPQGITGLEWYKDTQMANAPVVGINWFEAQHFCAWLGCRLPTELDWEYAARGVDNLIYPWGNTWNTTIPVWIENGGAKPNAVKVKPEGQSWVGAQHMSGNVWEWTASLYKSYPYVPDDGREENSGKQKNGWRVVRGGGWRNNNGSFLRAACRERHGPDKQQATRGFRVSRAYLLRF